MRMLARVAAWGHAGLVGSLAAIAVAQSDPPPAYDAPKEPKGVYAQIDARASVTMMQRLGTPGQQTAAVREVLGKPTAFTPPVLYRAASILAEDRPESAIFWYHVGRLRAVYDALRCKDRTANNVLPALGKTLGRELIRAQYFQRDRLKGIARKAVDWDQQNPRNYDQRWVCLHTKTAQTSTGEDAAEVQLPQEEWPAILKRVHDAHLVSVDRFVAEKPER